MRIRTKQGVVRRYNAIINDLYKKFKGGTQYGIDFPTIQACYPQIALKLRILKRLYKVLPDKNK